ncbi:MAG TPA: class I SAM-dependent methyltransferase [Vicinamibacterales bacterium]
MTGSPAPDHYSYTHYADPATAQGFEDLRFGGPVGELVAATQARVLANFIGRIQQRDILDVGTGTGRAARLLARGGARVTAVDASEAMLATARQRAAAEGISIRFQRGDVHKLDFADRSFDVVVSLRVLMHTPRWQEAVDELCRVATRLVVVDYPSARSVALLESTWRRMVYALGVKTEPYGVFTDRAIDRAFERNGFAVRSRHRQFVLPTAFHKAIGSARLTSAVERALDRIGLLALLGSPVSLVAERCASS